MATVTDVYIVNVPIDVGDEDERRMIAINQAREELSQVYAVPSNWFVPGEESIVVVRERTENAEFPAEVIIE